MRIFMIFLIIAAAIATIFVLGRGIYIMASGKDVTGEKSNQMMWYRVLFQGLTIALVVAMAAMANKHS